VDSPIRRHCYWTVCDGSIEGVLSHGRLGSVALASQMRFAKLVERLGQPARLPDVGVRREHYDPIAAGAMREHYDPIAAGAMQNVFVRSNPRSVTDPAQVREILDLAW
jgi:alcohol dehydrogenase class IV